MTGNAFIQCTPYQAPIEVQPCSPSPCGPNSQCRESNQQAICSCLSGYIGAPPSCRPECSISSDCAQNLACINQKCRDPCPGSCATNAICQVISHNPVCSCPPRYTGDPFTYCKLYTPPPAQPQYEAPVDPCNPSPCGYNARCDNVGDSARCSCLPQYIGTAPNCRPECTTNSDCDLTLACANMKCVPPCQNACGVNAMCHVSNHVPNCACNEGFTGDPFNYCYQPPRKIIFCVNACFSTRNAKLNNFLLISGWHFNSVKLNFFSFSSTQRRTT